jgi:hypothetical protein
MNEVREFCITNKLGPEITTPIVRFFRNLYPNETIIDEDAFLGELPGSLRKKVVMRLYAEVIRRVPLFKTLDEDATVAICTALRPLVAPAGELIFREGETATAVYFIIDGTCRVSIRGITLGHLKSGGFFGEMALLATGAESRVHNRTLWAHDDCQLR